MSTATTAARLSRAVPSFLGLPYEIIRSIMVQCDYFSLHALRRTCTAIKNMIENDPVFDAPLFRNRPLTNPTLTTDDMLKILRMAQTEEEGIILKILRMAQTEEEGTDLGVCLDASNPYINIHPALAQLSWDVCVDSYEDVVVKLTSRLTIDEVPHVLNECATCPPVPAVRLTMSIGLCSNNESWLIPKVNSNIPEVKPKQAKQQPILVRDVLARLVLPSNRMWLRLWQPPFVHEAARRYWHEDEEPENDKWDALPILRLTERPEMQIYDDGELDIYFNFEPTSGNGQTAVPR